MPTRSWADSGSGKRRRRGCDDDTRELATAPAGAPETVSHPTRWMVHVHSPANHLPRPARTDVRNSVTSAGPGEIQSDSHVPIRFPRQFPPGSRTSRASPTETRSLHLDREVVDIEDSKGPTTWTSESRTPEVLVLWTFLELNSV